MISEKCGREIKANVERRTSTFERRSEDLVTRAFLHFDVRRSKFDVRRSHLIRLCICLLIVCFSSAAWAADYFVDSSTGDDTAAGLSADHSWKSLKNVNTQTFKPGDRILLKAGTSYAGQLSPTGSGEQDHPIELTRYGDGANPRIDGNGTTRDALLLHNLQYWFVHDLEITNHGETTAPFRTGVCLEADNGQILHGLHISNLFVHDVNGDLRKEQEGCGIFFDSNRRGSAYDELTIEKCHIVHTDRNGLCQRARTNTRSTHVILRNNLLEDIGGDGIKIWGSNGAICEHNILHGGRMRCDDYAAGIWPFACDDCIIQFNEVSGMKGIKDGQGFDSDYSSRRNIFQYNYSHNNDGGFMLICSPGNSFCQGTIIRYNISQNDGRDDSRIFHFAGNSSDTLVYNNVIYTGPKQNLPLLDFDEWSGGNAHNTSFFNNIFYAEGSVSYRWGKSVNNVFDHNIFVGNHKDRPEDAHALQEKPALVNPGKGGDGMESLSGYLWQGGSALSTGRLVPDNGGRDFFGKPVPADQPPVIGVSQGTR
jgi:hypothetical protein